MMLLPQGRERRARLRAHVSPSIFVSLRSTVAVATES
jgi:hypothetical protein